MRVGGLEECDLPQRAEEAPGRRVPFLVKDFSEGGLKKLELLRCTENGTLSRGFFLSAPRIYKAKWLTTPAHNLRDRPWLVVGPPPRR